MVFTGIHFMDTIINMRDNKTPSNNMKEKIKVWAIRTGLVILFVSGFMAHDPVMAGWNLFNDLFPHQVAYAAPLSEDEQAIEILYKSAAWQKTCRQNAAVNVHYDLMSKYKEKTAEDAKHMDFPMPSSMPMSDAVAQASAEKVFVAK